MVQNAERIANAENSLQIALDGHTDKLWTALPCIVVDVDFANMTITAQPAIRGIITDAAGIQRTVNLPVLIYVPLVFPSAGGFTLSLPIAAGDEVLVVFSSRAIDGWWQSGGVQNPVESRTHDLSDGFAIPGPRSVPRAVTGISTTNAQLRTNDGTTYLEITPGGQVNIVATGSVHVTAPATTITSPEITLDGDVFISGSLTQSTGSGGVATLNGSLHVTGTIEADGDITAGTVSLEHHTHDGVQPGSGNTGEPN